MELSEQELDTLLQDVKNYLDITWIDAESDKKLTGIIARGVKYVNRLAAKPQDFTRENKARELLFEYCRYVRDEALHEFKINYLSDLIALQMDSEVEELASI